MTPVDELCVCVCVCVCVWLAVCEGDCQHTTRMLSSPSCQSPSTSTGEDDAVAVATAHNMKLLLKSPFSGKLGDVKYSSVQSFDD